MHSLYSAGLSLSRSLLSDIPSPFSVGNMEDKKLHFNNALI